MAEASSIRSRHCAASVTAIASASSNAEIIGKTSAPAIVRLTAPMSTRLEDNRKKRDRDGEFQDGLPLDWHLP